MLLSISHRTAYRYDNPVAGGLMRVRLTPRTSPHQQVLDWRLDIEGGTQQLDYLDHHGNAVVLVEAEPDTTAVDVTAAGRVETADDGGVMAVHRGFAPLWLFARPTELTEAGAAVIALAEAAQIGTDDPVAGLHRLTNAIADAVAYVTGHTNAATTAEEAAQGGVGVCQDHAHILIGAVRHLGRPARYVSGYLLMDGQDEQAASHGWAEVWVDDLGWLGLDVSNRISPDERYVRLATGLDYRDVAPIAGVRRGASTESMNVSISVTQQQQ